MVREWEEEVQNESRTGEINFPDGGERWRIMPVDLLKWSNLRYRTLERLARQRGTTID